MNDMQREGLAYWLYILLSPFVFIASLFFPAYYQDSTVIESGALLLMGWLGLLIGHFAWLANPLYLLGILCCALRPRLALKLMACALALAASFMFYSQVFIDEGRGNAPITGLGWGYFIWLMAIMLAFLSLARPLTARYVSSAWWPEISVIATATLAFGTYWWFNPSGYWQGHLGQKQFMDSNCAMARQVIHRQLPPVRQLALPTRIYGADMRSLLVDTDLEQLQALDETADGPSRFLPASLYVPQMAPAARYRFEYNQQSAPGVVRAWSNRQRIIDLETHEEVAYNIQYGYLPVGSWVQITCGVPTAAFLIKALSLTVLSAQDKSVRAEAWIKDHPIQRKQQ